MDLIKRDIRDRLLESLTTITGDVGVYAPYAFSTVLNEFVKSGVIDSFIINKNNNVLYVRNGWSTTISLSNIEISIYLRKYLYEIATKTI